MTEPKRGDRVRLTTKGGENTVTGEFIERTLNYFHIRIDGASTYDSFHIYDWNIEVAEPTTLDRVKALKPGAVIHNGQRGNATLNKSIKGKWYFTHSERLVYQETEDRVAEYLDGKASEGNWEIKYEGHEVT